MLGCAPVLISKETNQRWAGYVTLRASHVSSLISRKVVGPNGHRSKLFVEDQAIVIHFGHALWVWFDRKMFGRLWSM